MVVRSSYLHNEISYTGKMTSLYWFGPQGISSQGIEFDRNIPTSADSFKHPFGVLNHSLLRLSSYHNIVRGPVYSVVSYWRQVNMVNAMAYCSHFQYLYWLTRRAYIVSLATARLGFRLPNFAGSYKKMPYQPTNRGPGSVLVTATKEQHKYTRHFRLKHDLSTLRFNEISNMSHWNAGR